MAPERRYSRDHTWVERRDDALLVGLTAYAVDRLGNLRHLLLTAAGYIVLRVSYRQVTEQWDEIERVILSIVRRQGHMRPRTRSGR